MLIFAFVKQARSTGHAKVPFLLALSQRVDRCTCVANVTNNARGAQRSVLPRFSPIQSFSHSNRPADYPSIYPAQRRAFRTPSKTNVTQVNSLRNHLQFREHNYRTLEAKHTSFPTLKKSLPATPVYASPPPPLPLFYVRGLN